MPSERYNLRRTSPLKTASKKHNKKASLRRKFHLFPKLPLELRLMIWHLAEDDARIIHLTLHCRFLKWTAKASTRLRILPVNQEARSEMLKYYDQTFKPSIHNFSAQKIPSTAGFDPICELHFRWDQDLIYINIPWQRNWEGCSSNPDRLSFGEISNGILKEFIIEKSMLNKFAMTELSLRKIGGHDPESGNVWENPVMNAVGEVILVRNVNVQNITPEDPMAYVRKVEKGLDMVRAGRVDWKASIISMVLLCDLLKKHREDAAKKKRSRMMEKTFVNNSDRSNSSVGRQLSVMKDSIKGIPRSRAQMRLAMGYFCFKRIKRRLRTTFRDHLIYSSRGVYFEFCSCDLRGCATKKS